MTLDPRQVICETCHDSGWVTRECPGDETCGRWRQHLPHPFVTPCPCREGNAAYQEKQRRSLRRGGQAA